GVVRRSDGPRRAHRAVPRRAAPGPRPRGGARAGPRALPRGRPVPARATASPPGGRPARDAAGPAPRAAPGAPDGRGRARRLGRRAVDLLRGHAPALRRRHGEGGVVTAASPAITALRSPEEVRAFLDGREFPLVEGNRVTFVYHGAADAVALRHWIFGLPSR